MIEKTIGGQDALPNIADAERIFADLLQGLAAAQPGFPLAELKTTVDHEFAQIKHLLHGISLLGQCPDSVNAGLICRGEKLSIAIMAGLLRARGHQVTVIDPVEKTAGGRPLSGIDGGYRRIHAPHRRRTDPG